MKERWETLVRSSKSEREAKIDKLCKPIRDFSGVWVFIVKKYDN